jgi:hypothetical protein
VKLVRFNVEAASQKVWVLQHDLASIGRPAPKTRPIHLLTFLYGHSSAQLLQLPPARDVSTFGLCLALEAKLSAVKHFAIHAANAFARIQFPQGTEIAPFEAGTIFIAEIEAYLNAIYSSLELTNQIVRLVDPNVKQGFRNMAKKGRHPFDFKTQSWLSSFYDVRTELSHHGSPMPSIHHAAIVLEITQRHQTHRFEYGKRAIIPVAELLQYEDGLFAMLDLWATARLAALDPQIAVDQLIFDEKGRKGHKPTVRDLIAAHLDPAVPPETILA